MIWFLLGLPARVARLGFVAGRGTARLSHRSVRFVGYRRLALVGAGVALGLLVAPGPGAELRARLVATLGGSGGGGALRRRPPAALADRVREELAASPRTWHLPQPAVEAAAGRVVLTGEVPHATAAADLERTVLGVKGVTAVDNRLTIST